jgi:hypothetical protein
VRETKNSLLGCQKVPKSATAESPRKNSKPNLPLLLRRALLLSEAVPGYNGLIGDHFISLRVVWQGGIQVTHAAANRGPQGPGAEGRRSP